MGERYQRIVVPFSSFVDSLYQTQVDSFSAPAEDSASIDILDVGTFTRLWNCEDNSSQFMMLRDQKRNMGHTNKLIDQLLTEQEKSQTENIEPTIDPSRLPWNLDNRRQYRLNLSSNHNVRVDEKVISRLSLIQDLDEG